MHMTFVKSAIIGAVASLLLGTGGALAFECPQHIAAAEQQIAKLIADMQGMEGRMPPESMMQVASLLGNARMLLADAQSNHGAAEGPLDHALSLANADSALAYATAADILHFRFMQSL